MVVEASNLRIGLNGARNAGIDLEIGFVLLEIGEGFGNERRTAPGGF